MSPVSPRRPPAARLRLVAVALLAAGGVATLIVVDRAWLGGVPAFSLSGFPAWVGAHGQVDTGMVAVCGLGIAAGAWTAVAAVAGLLAASAPRRHRVQLGRIAITVSPPALRLLVASAVGVALVVPTTATMASAAPLRAVVGRSGPATTGTPTTPAPTTPTVGPPPTMARLPAAPAPQLSRLPSTPPTLGRPPTTRGPTTHSPATRGPTTRRPTHPQATPGGAPAAPAPAATAGATTWTVRPGDSFWAIARRLLQERTGEVPDDATVELACQELVAANARILAEPGDPDLLFVGQRLAIPTALRP